MGGLNDAAVRWDDLEVLTNFLLVATWGVYPDVVLR